MMTFFCFLRIEFKSINGSPAGTAVPTIGKQYAADICKYCIYGKFIFHFESPSFSVYDARCLKRQFMEHYSCIPKDTHQTGFGYYLITSSVSSGLISALYTKETILC